MLDKSYYQIAYTEHGPRAQVTALVRKAEGSQPDADAGQVPPLRGIHAGKGEWAWNISATKIFVQMMLISESTEQKKDKKDRWTNFSDGDACAHDEVVRHWGVNRDKCSGRSQPALWRGWHHDDQGTNSTENILVLSLGLNITTKLLNWVTFWARPEVKKNLTELSEGPYQYRRHGGAASA